MHAFLRVAMSCFLVPSLYVSVALSVANLAGSRQQGLRINNDLVVCAPACSVKFGGLPLLSSGASHSCLGLSPFGARQSVVRWRFIVAVRL